MLAATNPRNTGWEGGFYGPTSGTPTQAQGSFNGVGAANTPGSQIGTPAVAFARNNRGSNVRIPYARLVPLRSLKDARTANGKVMQMEYDGLHPGELAWILGRRLTGAIHTDPVASGPISDPYGRPKDSTGSDYANSLNTVSESAHILGIGHGVDRMQRLASTEWILDFVADRLNGGGSAPQKIALHLLGLGGPSTGAQNVLAPGVSIPGALDSELAFYQAFLNAGTALYAPDVAWMASTAFRNADSASALSVGRQGPILELAQLVNSNQAAKALGFQSQESLADAIAPATFSLGYQQQGLFVMERGPFLRSKPIGADPCTFAVTPGGKTVEAPRCLGSDLAWAALESELRRRNFFDWTPDGIVMSKFSTGPNAQSDAEIDARMAQLYNVAIQGQAIATTWTGTDMADMECLPMDKVFVVLVADLYYEVEPDDEARPALAKTSALRTTQRIKAYNDAADDEARLAVLQEFQGLTEEARAAEGAVLPVEADQQLADREAIAGAWDEGPANGSPEQLFDLYMAAKFAGDGPAAEELLNRLEAAKSATNWKDDAVTRAQEQIAADVRNGEIGVKRAVLANFRMKKVTSSYLQSHSHHDPDRPKSRCGLKIAEGVGEYIIGGWCIGTVLDSAASRSMAGNQVRTAPASMSLNVNVNVQWWTGDKLFKHYMDVDGTVNRRNDVPKYGVKVPSDLINNGGDPAKGSYAAGGVDGAVLKRNRATRELAFGNQSQDPEAGPKMQRVDRFGRALPRESNRGPRNGANYDKDGISIVPVTAF